MGWKGEGVGQKYANLSVEICFTEQINTIISYGWTKIICYKLLPIITKIEKIAHNLIHNLCIKKIFVSVSYKTNFLPLNDTLQSLIYPNILFTPLRNFKIARKQKYKQGKINLERIFWNAREPYNEKFSAREITVFFLIHCIRFQIIIDLIFNWKSIFAFD